ncbi:galanin receptor type 1 [Lepeophtheirus salmonis]|uniref:galanin receptor type 1 n=1 Tax=Lepeophtheirus salmonis TaxID=72036 RepID=UPI001AE2AE4A|nr:allatostatin-A receptor-like [Lepeophtheirus salmonis]
MKRRDSSTFKMSLSINNFTELENDAWKLDLNLTYCSKCSEVSPSEICRCMNDPNSALYAGQHLPELTLNLVTYVICIVLGLFWNLITLFVMIKGDRKNRSVTNIFLISLAVADLLLVSIAAPMELVHYFAPQFGSGGSGCKVAEYSRVISAIASILNLLAVTFERFIVIVFPMKSRFLCTMKNSRRGLGVVWGLSLLLTLPVLYTKSVYNVHYANNSTIVKITYCNDYDDSLGLAFSIYQLVVAFIVPGVIILVCYVIVIVELQKSTKRMKVLTNQSALPKIKRINGNSSPRKLKGSSTRSIQSKKLEDVGAQRKQVIKMLICVVCIFFLCWGPRFTMEIVIKSKTMNLFYPTVYWIRVVIFLLPFIHAGINPIIYIIMSKTFRSSIIKLLKENCSFSKACRPLKNNEEGELQELDGINPLFQSKCSVHKINHDDHDESNFNLKDKKTISSI